MLTIEDAFNALKEPLTEHMKSHSYVIEIKHERNCIAFRSFNGIAEDLVFDCWLTDDYWHCKGHAFCVAIWEASKKKQ